MPLVYLPDCESLFLWGSEERPRELAVLGRNGEPHAASLVTPEGRRRVDGLRLPLFQTMAMLAVVPAAAVDTLPASVATWAIASKLAIELASRERIVPTIVRRGERIEARWAAALSTSEDASRVAALARSMPPAAHAVPVSEDGALDVWAAEALLRTYLDAVVDTLVRASQGEAELLP